MKLKISRLFHWLYATLMFLPILMFIPSCLFYGFNEHATNETTTTINYKYQSNEVNTLDDLVVGNVYHLDINNTSFDNIFTIDQYGDFTMTIININSYDFTETNMTFEGQEPFSIQDNGNIFCSLSVNNDFLGTFNIYLTFNNDNDFFTTFTCDLSNNFSLDCDFIFNQANSIRYFDNIFITATDYNVIESVETNIQDTISNKIYLAWEGVWNLPLFQWTKNSFITSPFSYITGLFGLSSDNSINCVFTYFASISICWLVFDLIMYVPNLAHRWLDRSAIE